MFIHAPYFSKFKFPGLCDKFELDSILSERVKLYKSIGKFRYGKLLYESENSRKWIRRNYGLPSIAEIKNSLQEIRADALFIVNNYIEDFIWRINSTKYLFNSDSKVRMTTFQALVQPFF